MKQINPPVPSEVTAITTKAMEKDRSRRYQAAASMLTDLKRLRGLSQRRPSKWKVALTATLLVVLLAPIGLACWGTPLVPEWISGKPSSVVPQINSLAVLPLKNLTGDDSQEYF